ncbi:MAG: hypothetical protein JO095_16905, partial [Alphaproteobacteria bacterium]|nr:hypothetical protein [Alphaproteobacteria bacterium]
MPDPSALGSHGEGLALTAAQAVSRDTDRHQAMAAFLAGYGLEGHKPVPLAGDASFR